MLKFNKCTVKSMPYLTMGNGLSSGSMDGCNFADFHSWEGEGVGGEGDSNCYTGMSGQKCQCTSLFDACLSSEK